MNRETETMDQMTVNERIALAQQTYAERRIAMATFIADVRDWARGTGVEDVASLLESLSEVFSQKAERMSPRCLNRSARCSVRKPSGSDA